MAKRANTRELLADLNAAVRSSDAGEIRRAALRAGDGGVTRAIPVLLRLLAESPDIAVKNAAAMALGELRADQAVPMLVKLIRDPQYRKTRGTFVYALHTLDWHSKHAAFVASLLIDPNFEVREMARLSLKHASERMSRERKMEMLAVLVCWQLTVENYAPLSLARSRDIVDTVKMALPLLVGKKRARAAELAAVA